MKNVENVIEECEAALRAGQAQIVAGLLARVNTAQISRANILPLSNIARRAGCFTYGLKLLAPLTDPDRNKWKSPATAPELAEYAVLLQKIGAVEESGALLSSIEKHADSHLAPEAHLYRAFFHFHRWDGESAVPCLETYLTHDLEPYLRLVGRVNLAAALVSSGRHEVAERLLGETIEVAREQGHTRLLGNSLELRAQAHLLTGRYDSAAADLDSATALLATEATPDEFFVRKWRGILKSLRDGSQESLHALRAEALERKDWESVRDADFHLLKIRFDEKRFDHLYFGTPFEAYRKRLGREFSRLPKAAEYLLGGTEGAPVFDVASGRFSGPPHLDVLEPGSHCQRMIEALLKDFYRPIRIGGLFSALFPTERFDVFSSPGRIHQIMRRSRRLLEDSGLPVTIECESPAAGFRLEAKGPISFRVGLDRQLAGRFEIMFRDLKNKVDSRGFTSAEGADAIQTSVSTFKRLASWAQERGLIEKVGAGSGTFYSLCG
jgi:tetratricopeptide (TPR) repeat protein